MLKINDAFFKKLERIDQKVFFRELTDRAGVVAVNFSKERFRKKNWIDNAPIPWKQRKRSGRGSLMVNSGRLKRSIRKLSQGNYYVFIGTDVPYAKIHNEGGVINQTVQVRAHSRRVSSRGRKSTRGNSKKKTVSIAKVKAHSRRMNLRIVKRQFMGESKFLTHKIQRMMYKEVNNKLSR
jgi:phage gpG-like protein